MGLDYGKLVHSWGGSKGREVLRKSINSVKICIDFLKLSILRYKCQFIRIRRIAKQALQLLTKEYQLCGTESAPDGTQSHSRWYLEYSDLSWFVTV